MIMSSLSDGLVHYDMVSETMTGYVVSERLRTEPT